MEIPLAAMFLGPQAENAEIWQRILSEVFSEYAHWRKNCYPTDKNVIDNIDLMKNENWFKELEDHIDDMMREFKTHLPFHSPRYIGHMLSETSLPSVIGLFAGLLYNPNNVTYEAANKSVKWEQEFSESICKMLGYSAKKSIAHVCSGGSVANIEALWGARCVQFIPLAVKEYCAINDIDFIVTLPNNTTKTIIDVDDKTLLHLKTGLRVFLIDKLVAHQACKSLGVSRLGDADDSQIRLATDEANARWNSYYSNSPYNIRNIGLHRISEAIGLKPVVFLPSTAHYSFKKAMDILGYGADSLRYVDIDKHFRQDIRSLEKQIKKLDDNEFIAAVIAVAGSTEEGAVDPIHRIKYIRDQVEAEMNTSFWLHIDAAWGGYIRSLFTDELDIKQKATGSVVDIANYYNEQIGAVEFFSDMYRNGKDGKRGKEVKLGWQDNEVITAFLAFEAADSITVDPHKMGYVPYPAGVIAFKYKECAKHFSSKANYIFGTSNEMDAGRFSLEGTRPGSSVISCWFASKAIPLTRHFHGKIIKTSLLNALRFKYYLTRHKRYTFSIVDTELKQSGLLKEICDTKFHFELLYDNIDTNIVSYLVYPELQKNYSVSLKHLNNVNRKVYESMSMSTMTSIPQFHISSTVLETDSGYPYSALAELLTRFNICETEYEKEGLFVLRSVVMNPWYFEAMRSNEDYFMEFVRNLHLNSANAIMDTMFEWATRTVMKQVAVFLPNESGTFASVLDLLGQNGIRVHAMSIGDTESFGILRLITDDYQKAAGVLTKNNMLARVDEVIVIKITNIIKLEMVIKMFSSNDINIEYFYSTNETYCTVVVMRVNDAQIDNTLRIIKAAKKNELIVNSDL